jgi:hypothetical protein
MEQRFALNSPIIVWDLETIPDLRGFAPATVMTARAMTKFAPRWATSSRSTSITQSFALAL